MNTVVSEVPGEAGTESERQILLVCYILHALAIMGVTTVIGVVIDHIKAAETQSAFIRSHHVWLLRTFWWSLLWLVISGVLCLIVIGYLGVAATFLWWLYRVIRGGLAFIERRPMPV